MAKRPTCGFGDLLAMTSTSEAMAYSPDLMGLVEEGVLDFDLRLEDARASLGVVDAVDHAGRAGNANEFVLGLQPILIEAANNAEHILLRGAGLGAALLHSRERHPKASRR